MRRSRTNTPLAALALMNDEQFVEASRGLAERSLLDGGATDAERAEHAFRVATSRRPTAEEREVLLQVYRENRERFREDPDAAKQLIEVGDSEPSGSLDTCDLAAWTVVANLILNLDETITRE